LDPIVPIALYLALTTLFQDFDKITPLFENILSFTILITREFNHIRAGQSSNSE
jgi:hypothetical protein